MGIYLDLTSCTKHAMGSNVCYGTQLKQSRLGSSKSYQSKDKVHKVNMRMSQTEKENQITMGMVVLIMTVKNAKNCDNETIIKTKGLICCVSRESCILATSINASITIDLNHTNYTAIANMATCNDNYNYKTPFRLKDIARTMIAQIDRNMYFITVMQLDIIIEQLKCLLRDVIATGRVHCDVK